MRRFGFLIFCIAFGQSSQAQEAVPRFRLPVICEIGALCVIQNYYDHDPGPGFADYTGGSLSYDGHTGTDIRVPNDVAMRAGIPVVAAAPGVVRATRDGMADINFRKIDASQIEGRAGGNVVVVVHRNGWETIYKHLMKGSVAVKRGQRVQAGQVLGKIGLSGATEFPHLHLTVRSNGKPVDPFTGLSVGNTSTPIPLWTEEALAQLSYISTGVLSSGFAGEVPEAERARNGEYSVATLENTAPVIGFWVDVFGLRAGDIEVIHFLGPNGVALAKSEKTMPENMAVWFRFVGKRLKKSAWPPGSYRGEYRLLRRTDQGMTEVVNVVRTFDIKP